MTLPAARNWKNEALQLLADVGKHRESGEQGEHHGDQRHQRQQGNVGEMARQHRQAIVIDTLVQQPSEGDAGLNRRGQRLAAENDMVTP